MKHRILYGQFLRPTNVISWLTLQDLCNKYRVLADHLLLSTKRALTTQGSAPFDCKMRALETTTTHRIPHPNQLPHQAYPVALAVLYAHAAKVQNKWIPRTNTSEVAPTLTPGSHQANKSIQTNPQDGQLAK
jgi:hypothetical protein